MKILLAALLIFAQICAFPQVAMVNPLTGAPLAEAAEELPRFDLNFSGGPVDAFVQHLQDALKRVDETFFINVIIPAGFEHTPLPPLKMRNIDIIQLFRALEFASQKSVTYDTGGYTDFPGGRRPIVNTATVRYGFTTTGPITRNSIWHFYAQEPPRTPPVNTVQYFQLGPYLTQFTMDDIGSAIEAGWNLLGEKNTTKLNFHQDTKLLIAAGPTHQLEMINAMLKELSAGVTNAAARAAIEKTPWSSAPVAKQ